MAMRALGGKLRLQMLLQQLPLHEGRRNRVLASGPIQNLPVLELKAVRCGFGCHRECPCHTTVIRANEEQQVALETREKLNNQWYGHAKRGANPIGGHRRSRPHLSHHELADLHVVLGHE